MSQWITLVTSSQTPNVELLAPQDSLDRAKEEVNNFAEGLNHDANFYILKDTFGELKVVSRGTLRQGVDWKLDL
jgi:hypothetical protein